MQKKNKMKVHQLHAKVYIKPEADSGRGLTSTNRTRDEV